MKIIAKSNYDNPMVADELICENITNHEYGKAIVEFLNEKFGGERALYFFEIKLDSYKLYEFEP